MHNPVGKALLRRMFLLLNLMRCNNTCWRNTGWRKQLGLVACVF